MQLYTCTMYMYTVHFIATEGNVHVQGSGVTIYMYIVHRDSNYEDVHVNVHETINPL